MTMVSMPKGTSDGKGACVLLVEGVQILLNNTDNSKIVTDKVFLSPTNKEIICPQNGRKQLGPCLISQWLVNLPHSWPFDHHTDLPCC